MFDVKMDDFGKPMMDLGNAYRGRFAVRPDDSDSVIASVFGTWFKYLGEYEFEDFSEAVDEWIRQEDKPPTIKELTSLTRKHKWRREGYDV